jgi:hypothetical protein
MRVTASAGASRSPKMRSMPANTRGGISWSSQAARRRRMEQASVTS